MDIRILRYFLVTAQELSITKAAEILHTTQPNLSHQLADLEKELNLKLFLRENRRLTLTDEGLFLKKRAQDILNMVDKTTEEMSAFSNFACGDIYIGMPESNKLLPIARIIQSLHEQYPLIKFHFYSGTTYDILERLDNGLFDFSILIEPFDFQKYNFIQLPVLDIWGILMRKDSPLSSLNSIQAKDLLDKPLLSPGTLFEYSVFSDFFGNDIKKLNIIATYNLINNAVPLVTVGMGYAFSLEGLVDLSGNSELCFRPLDPVHFTKIYLVWRKNTVLNQVSMKFLEHFNNEFKKISL